MIKPLNKSLLIFLCVASFLFLGAEVTRAESSWVTVATLDAGGDEKVVAVDRKISKIAITCLTGSVLVNTVDVTLHAQTYAFKVGNRLGAEQSQQISVGSSLLCKTIKISESGEGRYVVKVKE